jgi:hypothetical protein
LSTFVDLSGAVLQRKFATFQNYLTVEEDHRDEAIITQHPVDSGAVMSDHIYLKPPTVKLRLGWSNSDDGASGPTYVIDTYKNLLALKNARKLFSVFTGKRIYNNMFVASLSVPTNSQSEYSMIADCELTQLLLVNTKSVAGKPTSTTAAPASNPGAQASPKTNQPTTDTGQNYPEASGFNHLESGTGPTQIPSGSPGLQSGSGPTEIPLGTPNDNGGASGPQTFYGGF